MRLLYNHDLDYLHEHIILTVTDFSTVDRPCGCSKLTSMAYHKALPQWKRSYPSHSLRAGHAYFRVEEAPDAVPGVCIRIFLHARQAG